MKAGIIAAVVFIVVAIVAWKAPLIQVPYVAMVDYEDTETYYESDPYQETETYIEYVPLTFEVESYIEEDTIPERHQIIIGGVVFQDEIVDVPIEIACVKVKNTDETFGIFIVSFSGFIPMFGEPSLTIELELYPGYYKTAECKSYSIDSWDYVVTPDTKEVEGERTVTKYEQVEKQRTVTRQREETRYKKVTLLDYLLHYQ